MLLNLLFSLNKNRLGLLHQRIIRKSVNIPHIYKREYEKCEPRLCIKRQFHNTPILNVKPQPEKSNDGKQKKNEDDNNSDLLMAMGFWMVTSYLFITIISIIFPAADQPEVESSIISWNEFLYDMLAKGEIERILVNPDYNVAKIFLHQGAVIKGEPARRNVYYMNIGDSTKFEEKLRKAQKSLGISNAISIDYIRQDDSTAKAILAVLFIAFLLFLIKAKSSGNIISEFRNQFTKANFTLVDPKSGVHKGVKFSDVAGLKEAKAEVMEFVDFIRNPTRYKALGAKVPKGALLLGPPGCGKTLLAKAVATESNVPFLSMNGSEFVEVIGGLGAARMRDLFNEAKIRSPCIIYIDELDAVGKKRTDSTAAASFGSSESDLTLNQLLVEMDGIASKENILVLASTNRPDVLDKALLRPGRFDRHILLDLPTVKERMEIFVSHLKKLTLDEEPHLYALKLCYTTSGFSGAQIANVCNEAALFAARHTKSRVTFEDLEYAVEKVKFGVETKHKTISKEEKEIVAFHESGHAIVSWFMEHANPVLKVSIRPRANEPTGFTQYGEGDKILLSKEELIAKMCMLIGGRAAETMIFNTTTTASQKDLQKVTKMANSIICEHGMTDKIGLMSFSEGEGKKPYSKALRRIIDMEAKRLLGQVFSTTRELLSKESRPLKTLARNLLAKETLNNDDIERLLGPSPNAKNKQTRFV